MHGHSFILSVEMRCLYSSPLRASDFTDNYARTSVGSLSVTSPATGSYHLLLFQSWECFCGYFKSAPALAYLVNICHRDYFRSPAFIFNIYASLAHRKCCGCVQILLLSQAPRDGTQTCQHTPQSFKKFVSYLLTSTIAVYSSCLFANDKCSLRPVFL